MPKKITEVDTSSTMTDGAYLLGTQQVSGVESLRRLPASVVAAKIAAILDSSSKYVNTTDLQSMYTNLVKDIQRNGDNLVITFWDNDTASIPVAADSGLSFDAVSFDEDTGYLHITMNGEDVVSPCYIPGGGGGGGGGSNLTFACYTSPTMSVLESSVSAEIEYKYTSVDSSTSQPTGSGTLKIAVGGVTRANLTVTQGDHKTVDVRQYLASGTNSVRLTITDSYGNSATRTFTITVEAFTVEWSLDSVQFNNESIMTFYITPTGTGTKTIYTYVDSVLHSTDSVTTSGRRFTKNISGLTHGTHSIEVYGTMQVDGQTLESNHLHAAVAQVEEGETDAIVAVNWPLGTLTEFTSVQIPYLVYDPANNPATVGLYEGTRLVNEISANQTPHTWTYRPAASGSVTARVVCGNVIASHTYTVSAITISAQEVTDGLVVKVDPSTISDLSTWHYGAYRLSMSSGFDTVNGGIVTDENGVQCIRITAGDRITLNYDPFADNPTNTGMELKLVYKISDCASKTAVGISTMNGNRGLKVQANNAYLYGNQSTVSLSLCEGERTELDVTIQQKTANSDRLMMLWEGCSTFAIQQYAVDESFKHSTETGITFGSDDADVYLYLVRAYSRDLTTTEIRENFIVDGPSGDEIYSRDQRNSVYSNGAVNFELCAAANPSCHFLLISAEKISTAKKKNGGTVSGTLRHVYADGGASHAFTADLNMDLQGTSSEEHALTAGPNLNLRFPNGMVFDSDPDNTAAGYAMHGAGDSIAVNLFNYKKNVASQDHIVNRVCAEWYNRFQPSIRQAREDDHRVRDCLECTMCAVFFHNTSGSAVTIGPDLVQPDETIFFGLGNLCSSKDCYDTFEYDDIVIEVKNNTEDQVRFKSDDLTGDNFDNNYEFRYLNEDNYTEAQAKAAWQTVQTFVYETDYTEATDEALPEAVTIGGETYLTDSADYRKARWLAEAPDIFDMDTLYWHHCITLFFLLRDNRAKNMFWSKSNDTGKWGLWFNWDNDTGLCRNNRGYVDIEPGYMDWDTLGTSDVFNAADNALFTNLRECNFAQLRAMYVNREAAGAWDIDDIFDYVQESQNQICEAMWVEDAERNGIRILENLGNSSYLERATGKLQLHIKKTLMFQKALVDSYFTAADSTTDRARLRGNTPSEYSGIAPSGALSLTPYTNMFINILAGSTSYRVRGYEGQAASFDISANLNDTEMYLYSAQWIQGMSSLAALYLSQCEIGTMKRIRQVILGSAEDGYYNAAAMSLSFDNCKKLEQLNLAGLTGTTSALNFANNIYLQQIDTRNSGITGLRFARNGRLATAALNALTSLYLSGLRNLSSFSMAAYTSLTSLTIENCPAAVAPLTIVNGASGLENLRLLGVNWTLENARLLKRLAALGGLDDGGTPSAHAIVTGSAHITMISEGDLAEIQAAFPNLAVTYDSIVPTYTVRFLNSDGTVLHTQRIGQGSAPADPTELETDPIETPTKAATAALTYTFDGWSWTDGGSLIADLSAVSITQDTDIYAHYESAARLYTIRFMNGSEVLETKTAQYGAAVSYTGSTPVHPSDGDYATYYLFKGWDKSTGNISSNLDVFAQYDSGTAPSAGTLSGFTPAQLKALIATEVLSPTGANNNLIASGDTIDIVAGRDFNFSNVQSHELISLASPKTFDGTNYFKPQIENEDICLFDMDKSWTLAIDFAFDTSCPGGGCLAASYHSNGFLLRYSSGGSVRYGASTTQQVSTNGVRQITVIRKKAGDDKLYCYASNKNGNDIAYSALEQATAPSHEAPLAFGATIAEDSYVDNYGVGTVYWAKLWEDDLGDAVCRELVCWPRQTFQMQAVGSSQYAFRNFTRVDNQRYVNCCFLMKELLEETHQMNPTATNAGGWASAPIRTWLNTRWFNALPVQWQQMILTVYVHSNTGYQATGLVDPPAEDKIWIPSCKEAGFNNTQSPYSLESDAQFTVFTDNASRIRKLDFGSGAASYWWLRSPNTGTGTNFWNVNTSGSSSGNYSASGAYGVAPGFCI